MTRSCIIFNKFWDVLQMNVTCLDDDEDSFIILASQLNSDSDSELNTPDDLDEDNVHLISKTQRNLISQKNRTKSNIFQNNKSKVSTKTSKCGIIGVALLPNAPFLNDMDDIQHSDNSLRKNNSVGISFSPKVSFSTNTTSNNNKINPNNSMDGPIGLEGREQSALTYGRHRSIKTDSGIQISFTHDDHSSDPAVPFRGGMTLGALFNSSSNNDLAPPVDSLRRAVSPMASSRQPRIREISSAFNTIALAQRMNSANNNASNNLGLPSLSLFENKDRNEGVPYGQSALHAGAVWPTLPQENDSNIILLSVPSSSNFNTTDNIDNSNNNNNNTNLLAGPLEEQFAREVTLEDNIFKVRQLSPALQATRSTSNNNHKRHQDKLLSNPAPHMILNSGNSFRKNVQSDVKVGIVSGKRWWGNSFLSANDGDSEIPDAV